MFACYLRERQVCDIRGITTLGEQAGIPSAGTIASAVDLFYQWSSVRID